MAEKGSDEDLLERADLGKLVLEMLQSAAEYVTAKATADKSHDRVVSLARRIAGDNALTDEHAISAAGRFASELLRYGSGSTPEPSAAAKDTA